MNLPKLPRVKPVYALMIIALVLVMLPQFDSLFFAGQRYTQCGHLAQTQPEKALALARDWRKARPDSPLAKHCEALALYGTRDYAPAGAEFVELGKQVTSSDPSLAMRLFLQGGNAYVMAKQQDNARQALAAAVILDPKNTEAQRLLSDLSKENGAVSSPNVSAKKLH